MTENSKILKKCVDALKVLKSGQPLGMTKEDFIDCIIDDIEFVIKPTLSEDEKTILRNLSKEYKWIARDNDGSLYLYSDCPDKEDEMWVGGNSTPFIYDNLFRFIKWVDEEPYLISELLGEE